MSKDAYPIERVGVNIGRPWKDMFVNKHTFNQLIPITTHLNNVQWETIESKK